MRVLQISNYYFPHTGGIEQVCRNIVNSLKDTEIEQKVICFNEDADRDGLNCKRGETTVNIVDGVEIHRCGCVAKIASQSISLTYLNELRSLINVFNPDIIIFHYPNPFVASFLLPLIKENVKFILFWTLDIVKQKGLRLFFHEQNIKLLERADLVVASSPNYIEGSKYLFRYKNKCTVIPNCISSDYDDVSNYSIDRAKRIRNEYKDKCICFTVGRHIPYKGFEYLIDSARYLDDQYVILIGGKGPLTENLQERSSELKNVRFLGFLPDKDLKAFYMASDIITFSSITKNEAFGLSLAEGMYFGKPAVTFTIPGSGVNYVSLNGVTGLEVPNKNSKAYAEAIKKLHNNIEIYNRYSVNAKQRVNDLFTFDSFRNNILNMIDSLQK